MNANELIDELEIAQGNNNAEELIPEAITMLRQQQAEIEALKQIIDANNLNQNIGQFVKPTNEPVAWFTVDELNAWADKKLKENPQWAEQPTQQQEPVAWVYPEGLEALKAGKPWTAYGTRQEPNNTALYLSSQPDIPPYAWVTFTPYGDEDDVWYENPEGQLLEGWTYKPLYDTTPPQRKPLTDEEIGDFEHQIIRACGLSTANSDINPIGIRQIIKEILLKAQEK